MRGHGPEETSKAAAASLPRRPFLVISCTLHCFLLLLLLLLRLLSCVLERDRVEMEGRKSFVDEFFPRNNEKAKAAKYDSLGSLFPPLSTVAGKDSERSASWRKTETEGGNSRGSTDQNQSTAKKSNKPLNLYDELPESCLMSSSVYYGGRDDYIPQTSATQNSGAHYSHKKNNREDDLGNSEVATRGDWWQGSYHY